MNASAFRAVSPESHIRDLLMDLVSRIQRLPVGRFHYMLLVVIGLGWMFDAMDNGLISFILAKMAEDWQMTPD